MAAKRLSPDLLELVASRFRAMGEPARLSILNALRGGPRTVTELVEETGLAQTNVSKHLAVLRGVGLVSRQRVGSFVHYGIADTGLHVMCDLMCDSLKAEAAARHQVVA